MMYYSIILWDFVHPFWAAASKGRCPVEHRGKVGTYVHMSVPPLGQKLQFCPIRPEISQIRPRISPVRPKD